MTPKQMSLSMQHDAGFERQRKATRRDVFLAEMDQVVPWSQLCAVIEPHYPKEPVGGGRHPLALDVQPRTPQHGARWHRSGVSTPCRDSVDGLMLVEFRTG